MLYGRWIRGRYALAPPSRFWPQLGAGGWAQGQRAGALPRPRSLRAWLSFPAWSLDSAGLGPEDLEMCFLNQGLGQASLGEGGFEMHSQKQGGEEAEREGSSWREAGRQACTAEGGGPGRWGPFLGSEQPARREQSNSSDNSKQWAIRKPIMSAFEMSRMITCSAGLPSQL